MTMAEHKVRWVYPELKHNVGSVVCVALSLGERIQRPSNGFHPLGLACHTEMKECEHCWPR